MRILLLFIILFICGQGFGQIGVNARYGDLSPHQWEEETSSNLFHVNYEFGIDYWLRLKNYRAEFTPEIFISNSGTGNESGINYKYAAYGIAANSNFYIFDFLGDCDCPTFSKQGNFFSKGFFISVSPILSYQSKNTKSPDESELSFKDFQFEGAIGAGLDIGVHDLLTISPFVRYRFQPMQKWEGFNEWHGSNINDKRFVNSFLQLGIRLGFRPDYVKQQRRFRR